MHTHEVYVDATIRCKVRVGTWNQIRMGVSFTLAEIVESIEMTVNGLNVIRVECGLSFVVNKGTCWSDFNPFCILWLPTDSKGSLSTSI